MQVVWDSKGIKPILTASGRLFYPTKPEVAAVDVYDIAHALSHLCRFGGHCLQFYSVAEHSVHVARWVWKETRDPLLALRALMHDGSEAYLVDMPRPIKAEMPQYVEIEARIQTAIEQSLGLLPSGMPAIVKEADNRILITERDQNLISKAGWWPDVEPLPVTLKCWSPNKARRQFIRSFNKYQEKFQNA